MKTIKLILSAQSSGSIVAERVKVYDSENLSTSLVVSFTKVADVVGFSKFVSFKTSDGVLTTLPEVDSPCIEDILTIPIANYLSKAGTLVIQPFALGVVDGETVRYIFQRLSFNVDDFIGISGDTPENDTTIDQLLLGYTQLVEDVDELSGRVDAIDGGETSMRWIEYVVGFSTIPTLIYSSVDYVLYEYTYTGMTAFRKIATNGDYDEFYSSYVDQVLSGLLAIKEI